MRDELEKLHLHGDVRMPERPLHGVHSEAAYCQHFLAPGIEKLITMRVHGPGAR